MMTGWGFFFTLMGVATLAAQVFRVVDYIERPARHPRRSAAAPPEAAGHGTAG